MSETDSLLVRLLKSKYGISRDGIRFVNSHGSRPVCSYSWRGLFGALKDLVKGLKWRIGSGAEVIGLILGLSERPILSCFEVIPPYVNYDARVSEFIDGRTGNWNSDLLFAQLPL